MFDVTCFPCICLSIQCHFKSFFDTSIVDKAQSSVVFNNVDIAELY